VHFLYDNFVRPALFKTNPERSHGLSIRGLKCGLAPSFNAGNYDQLRVSIGGLEFPNPLGMAAGYDKNADVPAQLLKMGFGHVEIGTVTPQPQPGNPRPRIFRLIEEQAIINRLGFNSKGHAAVKSRLENLGKIDGIVGINIGANKTSTDFAADYVEGIHAFGRLARYFTINISSPNTPGLRALQGGDPLSDLLKRVCDARYEVLGDHNSVPIFLKIAPDLNENEMDDIARAVLESKIDALIVSNTTLSRSEVAGSSQASESGGLSGKPLFHRATVALAKMYQRVGGRLPLLGVGGIHDTDSAFKKLEAGASLVQLYSAMVYAGPRLPASIVQGLNQRMTDEKLTHVGQITGRKADEWAKMPMDPET